MKDSSRRARHGQGFRLEALEDRNLLSHSGASPFPSFLPAPKHPPLPRAPVIHGQVHINPAPSGLYSGTPAGELSYSGSGSAHPGKIGVVLFGTNQAETPNATRTSVAITKGTAVFRSLFGEQIDVNYTGTELTPRRGKHTITLTGTIASGTGQFISATGTFSATGFKTSHNQAVLHFTLVPVYATT
jgi:hypothetical protein